MCSGSNPDSFESGSICDIWLKQSTQLRVPQPTVLRDKFCDKAQPRKSPDATLIFPHLRLRRKHTCTHDIVFAMIQQGEALQKDGRLTGRTAAVH